MPIVIHTREAEDDTFRILEEEGGGGDIAGVFHCFTGGRRMGERAWYQHQRFHPPPRQPQKGRGNRRTRATNDRTCKAGY